MIDSHYVYCKGGHISITSTPLSFLNYSFPIEEKETSAYAEVKKYGIATPYYLQGI